MLFKGLLINETDTLCTVQCIKISYRTVTVQHVYKDDVEEGQTAKPSAANSFAFTQPCIMVDICAQAMLQTEHLRQHMLKQGCRLERNSGYKKKFVEENFC